MQQPNNHRNHSFFSKLCPGVVDDKKDVTNIVTPMFNTSANFYKIFMCIISCDVNYFFRISPVEKWHKNYLLFSRICLRRSPFCLRISSYVVDIGKKRKKRYIKKRKLFLGDLMKHFLKKFVCIEKFV